MMAIVQTTAGQLETTSRPNWFTTTPTYNVLRLYDQYYRTYAALYREQPNVRTCVDFLARNIAQIGLHVFRRVSDTDRKRLADHGLAQVLERPLPPEFKITRYRLFESLMSDLGVYFNAFWLKIRSDAARLGLLRIPPELVDVKGNLVITGYDVHFGGRVLTFAPGEIVHFRGYNAESATTGLSPLETLRRILAEEHAAGDNREHLWENAARQVGVLERPATAPPWSPDARELFASEWAAMYAGGQNAGKTAILEEGMTWRGMSFNSQEMEYLGGRKLTREECARAYHIPLPMVGILDNATFSNIKEQHKNLYQDSLGPWLAMIEDDIELQLLPEFDDVESVYVEFNIAEKLQGAFEDQVKSLQSAVGRPWMTPDEARGLVNLPSLGGDAERLAVPLNVLIGGQASPQDSDSTQPQMAGRLLKARGIDSYHPRMRQAHEAKWAEVLGKFYDRQGRSILSRMPKGRKLDIGGVWFDEDRWNSELQTDLLALNTLTATAWMDDVAAQIGTETDPDKIQAWLIEHSRIQAAYMNGYTMRDIEAAMMDPEPHSAVKDLFVSAATTLAWSQARTGVTAASNFGSHEAARVGGLKSKTWRTNSQTPRPSHASMAGYTVNIGELFPLGGGMRWPGDPAGGAEECANCVCSVVFNR